MITAPTEIAASTAIAIRIGTNGDEDPPLPVFAPGVTWFAFLTATGFEALLEPLSP